MPSDQELEKLLDERRQPKWVDRRIKSYARLPGKARKDLRTVIDSSRSAYDRQRYDTRLKAAESCVGSLSNAQRTKLWTTLFPKAADHFERAWLDAGQRPYQVGYERYPFRAPKRSDTVAELRARFLVGICDSLQGFDEDIEWIAAWAPHLPGSWWNPDAIGWLLSSALRNGGNDADRVREVLERSIQGEHEVGQMGRHVIVALLNSDDPGDWETVGKLLLAAQRQEGLRQSILEAVDEAHPGAFRYMLGLVLEHNLARFSATVRAFDVWLGLQWAGGSVKAVNNGIAQICNYFDDDTARYDAIQEGGPEDAYFALWVTAYRDAQAAVNAAARMLEDPTPERRLVAILVLDRLVIFPETLDVITARFLSENEDDERLTMAMAEFFAGVQFTSVSDELFRTTARLFASLPARKKIHEPIVWPWMEFSTDRRTVANALRVMAKGAPEKLIPFAHALDSHACVDVICELAGIGRSWLDGEWKTRKRRKLSPEARKFILQSTCDARQGVQEAAFEALKPLPVEDDEIELLLANLHRSAASLRQGALDRLSKLPVVRILDLAALLLGDSDAKKRAAGLELAVNLIESKRSPRKARELIELHRERTDLPNRDDSLSRMVEGAADSAAQEECFGLVPPGSRCAPIVPKFVGVRLETSAAKACLRETARLFLEHGDAEIEVFEGDLGPEGHSHVLLASAGWRFPQPKSEREVVEDARERLPLADTWFDWLENRSSKTRDRDGLELVRAWAWTERGDSYRSVLPKEFNQHGWELSRGYCKLLRWLALLSRPVAAGSMLTQYVEDALVKSTPTPHEREDLQLKQYYGKPTLLAKRLEVVHSAQYDLSILFTPVDAASLGALGLLAIERDSRAHQPSIENFVAAYDAGFANDRDLVWLLLQRGSKTRSRYGRPWNFDHIGELTRLKTHPAIGSRDKLISTIQEIRERLVGIEVTRGERPSPASAPASQLKHAGGASTLFELASALGRDKLVRIYQWGDIPRATSLSRLISVTAPVEGDTPQKFMELFKASGIKESRLIEISMFAPQWAAHVEYALNIKGLENAVWWIHAHTKRSDYWSQSDIRDLWESQIAERTELTADDLEEGAVDVAWFRNVIGVIGKDSWLEFEKSAKYASNSGGHMRARLFANAMLGQVNVDELLARIDEKRHQDSVRALGLVPLPKGKRAAQKELLARYKRLQEFKRESRKFGSQRQASEGRAVEIGMQNLARTAGYRDPLRLQWAMEAEAVADLAKGPVSVKADETTVSLAITESGDPELTVTKTGKPLKNVPAKLRKRKNIAALKSRLTELRRQRSRMTKSLEESMCRGDAFSREEFKKLFEHPMLRPMVERLVFIGDGDLIGFPDKGGQVLRNHSGSLEPIGKNDELRIAHAVDLLQRGDWSEWQRDCFLAERVQPFKQVFREVYPKTASELDKCDMTRRYAGHQVNPRQALALLKSRKWVYSPEEGVRRVDHDANIISELWFQQYFFTPADVEDLTLEGVAFSQRGKERKRILISDVPDRLFSETMRDVDLVVSVAHSGGVDPEASASTVEMRAALVRETCQLLAIDNVRVEKHHVLIDGERANYSVHLGSATTKVLPGRVLIIVAVHSQYRGRLFLPFADDDPKTAEVLAKTLLLARDTEIKDPRILDQIRG